jgi:hypothetical protein
MQVIEDRTDFGGFEDEFRHVRMATETIRRSLSNPSLIDRPTSSPKIMWCAC